MGSNVYLKHPASYGYQAGTTAVRITQFIGARAGERIAIRAFGFFNGSTVSSIYFMQEQGNSTMVAAVASNATTGFVLNSAIAPGNLLGTGDYVAIELENNTYQVTTILTGASSNFSIGDNLTDDVLSGALVYLFGVFGDAGQIAFSLASAVQTTKELDGGIFYSDGVGKAMLVYYPNATVDLVSGSIDYITVDYLNV